MALEITAIEFKVPRDGLSHSSVARRAAAEEAVEKYGFDNLSVMTDLPRASEDYFWVLVTRSDR